MTSTRILIVGQASQKTGLARVTRAIADHLAPHYDVHVLGIDCADRCPAGGRWTLHHNAAAYDPFAELRLTALIGELQPALLLLYHDFPILERYQGRIAAARHRCPVIGYCPIDAPIADSAHMPALLWLDALVVFTEFARDIVHGHPAIYVIPHGLNTTDFHPVHNARETLFPDRPDLWDGFWVLNANRNQPRKRLDLTMRGFARFAADKPADVRLYLHCGLNDIGIDIKREAQILGIEDRLLFTHNADTHPDVSTAQLNLIYNACDVGVNTAFGEGWGLVACEHAATRKAQIVPRHSACAELWTGAAELLEPVRRHDDPLCEGGIIDPADLAARLETLYADPQYRESRAAAAYERITSPKYRWERIAEQWRAVFDDITSLSPSLHIA
jgi:D-inositol-3-phosphate glycosyltransferase